MVIPDAASEAHLRDNLAAGGVVLTEAEIDVLRAKDRGARRIDPPKSCRPGTTDSLSSDG